MFRLAHMSDPHLSPLDRVRVHNLLSKRILGYINFRRNRGRTMTGNTLADLIIDMRTQEPNHIAVTGDLMNIALDSEVEVCAEWLKALGPPETVSVVPGNHDAYVPGALEKAALAWAPYMSGLNGDKKKDKYGFPYLRTYGDVAIIGLSTATSTGPFMATGTMGKEQADNATRILGDPVLKDAFRVVLIHHPPISDEARYHKRMTDIARFQAMIAETGANLVIHGHTHRRSLNHIKGVTGDVPVVGVTAASSGLGGKNDPASYNLFDIERDGNGWRCHHTIRALTGESKWETVSEAEL